MMTSSRTGHLRRRSYCSGGGFQFQFRRWPDADRITDVGGGNRNGLFSNYALNTATATRFLLPINTRKTRKYRHVRSQPSGPP
jgi:hypothetical protein